MSTKTEEESSPSARPDDDLYIVIWPHVAVTAARFLHYMEDGMAHAQCIVVRDQGQWKISLDGVRYGPYSTQRDAIRAAVDAAHKAGRKGLSGQVLLQDQLSVEWTYGKDPYPPNSSDYLRNP